MVRCINIAATLLANLLVSTAYAASFTVTTVADSGNGSLRAAITSANSVPNSPHTITFSAAYPAGGTIALASALPLILVQNLTISGGNRSPVINGQNAHQIFRVNDAATTLDISDLSLINGYSTRHGGCIYDASNVPPATGTLRLTRVVFSGCHAIFDHLVWGGAVYWPRTGASLAIESSRFTANYVRATQAQGQSGGGAIYTKSHTTITNSWFEGNQAGSDGHGGWGGALYLTGVGQVSSLRDSTFRDNAALPLAAPQTVGSGGAVVMGCDACSLEVLRNYFRGNAAVLGGAVQAQKSSAGPSDVALTLANNSFVSNQVVDSGGAVYVFNTTLALANNTFYSNDAANGAHLTFGWYENSLLHARGNLFAPTASGTACSGTASLLDPGAIAANLLGDASCAQLTTAALPNSPLGTITLDETPGQVGVVRFTGSAVIDSISNSALCEPHDARNQQRPIDGNGDGTAHCDVGAYEHPGALMFRDGFENESAGGNGKSRFAASRMRALPVIRPVPLGVAGALFRVRSRGDRGSRSRLPFVTTGRDAAPTRQHLHAQGFPGADLLVYPVGGAP